MKVRCSSSIREVALDFIVSVLLTSLGCTCVQQLGCASPLTSEWHLNVFLAFPTSGVPELDIWPVKVRSSSSMREVALEVSFSLRVHAPAFNNMTVHDEDLHNGTSTCF